MKWTEKKGGALDRVQTSDQFMFHQIKLGRFYFFELAQQPVHDFCN